MSETLQKKEKKLKETLFIKKRLQHKCFLVNIVNFLRSLILKTSANDCFCISEIQTTNNVIYALAENLIFNFSI